MDQPQLAWVPTFLSEPLFHTGLRGLGLKAAAVAIQAVVDLWGHPSSEGGGTVRLYRVQHPGLAPGPHAGDSPQGLCSWPPAPTGTSAPLLWLAASPAHQELFAHVSGRQGVPATPSASSTAAPELWPEARGLMLTVCLPGRPHRPFCADFNL